MSKKLLVYLFLFAMIFVGCSTKKDEGSPSVLPVPESPSNITVTGGNQLLDVTWDKVESADGYIIYLGGSPRATTVDNSAIINGLKNGQEYIITIASKNSNGRSETSQNVLGMPNIRETIPSKVTELTGVSGDTSVSLNWKKATNASEYRVYVYKNTEATSLFTYDVAGLSHKVAGLTNGQAYDFKIVGINDKIVEGEASDIFTAAPVRATTPPQAPDRVEVYPANMAVLLQWDAVKGAGSYVISKSSSETGTYTVINTVSATTYNVTGLINGSKYWFKIAASNRAGTGSPTAAIGVAPTVQVGIPAVVSGIKASGITDGINLSWNLVPGADSYKIYSSDTESGEFALLSDTNEVSFTVTGLDVGKVYWFKVAASNGEGDGGSGSAVAATPIVNPGAPTGLNATAGDEQAVLSWNLAAGATSYIIYDNDTESNFVAIATVFSSPYTVTGLTNNTEYAFKVEATNIHAKTMSLTKHATPIAPVTIPFAPSGVTANAGNGSVRLSWSVAAGARGYNVYQSVSVDGNYTLVENTSDIFYNVTGLTNKETYWFKIKSENAIGESTNYSIAVAATPEAPIVVPPAPTGLSAVAGDGSVVLSWQYANQAESYDIYQSKAGGAYANIGNVFASPYTIKDLTNTVEYSYKILAKNSAGSGAFSIPVSVTPRNPQLMPPATPTNITATPAYKQVSLSWNEVPEAKEYIIELKAKDSSSPVRFHTSSFRYVMSKLENNKTYEFNIRAVGWNGVESAQSATVTATTNYDVPPPIWSTLILNSGCLLRLTWLPVDFLPPVTGYTLYFTTGDVNSTYTALETFPSSKLTDEKQFPMGSDYSFKLKAISGDRTSGFSFPVTFSCR